MGFAYWLPSQALRHQRVFRGHFLQQATHPVRPSSRVLQHSTHFIIVLGAIGLPLGHPERIPNGMRRAHPLPDHPEFSIIDYPSCREFRVENWRLARDGSRKVINNAQWSWFDVLLPVVIAIIWPQVGDTTTNDMNISDSYILLL